MKMKFETQRQRSRHGDNVQDGRESSKMLRKVEAETETKQDTRLPCLGSSKGCEDSLKL
jgi:hypothetical protein